MSGEEKAAAEAVDETPAEEGAQTERESGEEGAAPATTDPGELHALLEDARAKADEHWNQCLRLQAELENLRKRAERDVANAHKFALEKFLTELLPVKDSLEMGLAAASEEGQTDVAKLKEGTELTLKMLASALEKYGIKEVDPEGEKFDPAFHEAMSMQEREDVEPNTVVTVVQKGYTLNDRLIRPAMVIVAKAPAD